jgi:EAL domain-containing protein (putative c-di-GMP-specific phosphodiesterase class I)
MPLTDLIRYFNVADTAGESTLYPEGQRAAAWHRGLRLGSLFEPIVDLRREKVVGHQARLTARREDGTEAGASAAYAACESAESVVRFDRLCRTLHALNFLAQQRYAGGYLQLSVHPRHVLAVQNQHGLVYEAILKRCGLAPDDIVLHIDLPTIGDHTRLAAALTSYRQRGYRLALSGPDTVSGVDELLDLEPDILKLPAGEGAHLIEAAHHRGILIEQGGIESARDFSQAGVAAVDLGRGSLFGTAAPDCRPTHDKRRVAYNHPSPFGASK